MRLVTTAIFGAVLLASLSPARAQDAVPNNPALNDTFYFGLGAFHPKTTTSARVDTPNGVGANVDFEQALGMTTQKTVPDAFGRWRFSQRWRFEVEYFQLNRSGDKTVGQDIEWNGQLIPAQSEVKSKFNFEDIRTSVGYSFFKTKDKELGVGFGFHVATYDIGLEAVSGPAVSAGNQAHKVLAPLPVFSVYGLFALTDEWSVGGRMDRFVASYDKYDGNITSMALDVNYQPFRHVGFGLAYRSLFIVLKYTGSDYNAQFAQTFQGPLLYLNASF